MNRPDRLTLRIFRLGRLSGRQTPTGESLKARPPVGQAGSRGSARTLRIFSSPNQRGER